MVNKKRIRRHYEKVLQETKMHKANHRNKAVRARCKQEQGDGCFSFVIIAFGFIITGIYLFSAAVV